MMARSVPFDLVTRLMTLHFVTRQIHAGSGRVGIGENSEIPGYQLSQRADYIHAKVGLQTTFERPIINTRDESHSTDEYRRLHVIVGDANRMEVPQALKLGTTSMLLWLLEHADEAGFDLNAFLDELELADPVEAMHTVSHDLTLGASLPLANGGETNAWLIQLKLRQAVYQVAALVEGTDTAGEPAWPDKSTTSIMAMWQQALIDCASIRHTAGDDERLAMTGEASRIEWLLKWQLLENCAAKSPQRPHPAWPTDGMIATEGHRPEMGGARPRGQHLHQTRTPHRTGGERRRHRTRHHRTAGRHPRLAQGKTRGAIRR